MDELFAALREAADVADAHAWVVGGYVRDRLLGRESHDLDVVVEDGRALEVAAAFARSPLCGGREPVTFPTFGTAQVATLDGTAVEFVSARRESYLPDSRRPAVEGGTLLDDLRRRDFTVNAILMDLDGQVSDPLGGRGDLARGLIRTPTDPEATFADDPLRMFRAVRFAAQLGFDVDVRALAAIKAMHERARPPKVSVERVTDELRKMLCSERPRLALELMDATGLLGIVLPELGACHGVEQNHHHRADVFWHTLYVVEATAPDPVLRLAAVFHDVGKPATRGEGGTFYGHQDLGAALAAGAMARLRFPAAETAAVTKLVRLHMQPMRYTSAWGAGGVRRLARDAGDLLPRLMALARADAAGSAEPRHAELDELEARLAQVRAESPSRLAPPVNGNDVMAALGMAPGPAVGVVLKLVGEMVIDGSLPPDREAVLAALPGLRPA